MSVLKLRMMSLWYVTLSYGTFDANKLYMLSRLTDRHRIRVISCFPLKKKLLSLHLLRRTATTVTIAKYRYSRER